MVASPKVKKVLQRGKKESSVAMLSVVSAISRVASYLKTSGRQRFYPKDPTNKGVGTVEYQVHIEATDVRQVTFNKLAHARSFRKLLKLSSGGGIQSDIIRTDTTDEGLVVSERKIK